MPSLVATGWGQGWMHKEKNREPDPRERSKQVAEQGWLWQAGLLPSWHCLLHVAQAGVEWIGMGVGTKLRTNHEGQRNTTCPLWPPGGNSTWVCCSFASEDPPGPGPDPGHTCHLLATPMCAPRLANSPVLLPERVVTNRPCSLDQCRIQLGNTPEVMLLPNFWSQRLCLHTFSPAQFQESQRCESCCQRLREKLISRQMSV